MNRTVLCIICNTDLMAFNDQLLIIKKYFHDVCEKCPCSKVWCLFIQEKSWPYCTCSLQEKESKHGWCSLQKETKKSKKFWNDPTLLFGVHSSSFLCPILVSDIIKAINIQGKSQGKCDHLIAETCWSQCYSDLKLTSSCGLALDRLSPESLCWTTSWVLLCLVA